MRPSCFSGSPDSIEVGDIWGGEGAPPVDLMRLQMETLYNLNAWNNARVKRLCDSAGITLEGLCAMAGVYGGNTIKGLVNQAARREKLEREKKAARLELHRHASAKREIVPPPVSIWKWPWPIALHFAKIEKFLYEQKFATPTTIGVEELAVSKLFKERAAEPVILN